MTKTYRIRTTPGEDKNIRINVNQDFDFLEILSLKLRQDDVYTRFCADYGVVVGRVITNGGYGITNANVSVFVPLTTEDENNPVISTLYPYKRIDQKNEDGYRYNLLPYIQEYQGHTPTGTFPDREDVLTRREVLEVYEKYYKYTVKTNESGDFMIIGVPLGQQVVMLDLDLSNIGCFSLSPSDLIRLGRGASGQFNGNRFKSSTDLDSLPQIVNQKKEVNVTSFWGENEICDIGITRVDFDLRDLGIEIKPQAIFMGSIFSSTEEDFLKSNCKPKKNTGNLCDMTTGTGKILALRQTINYDTSGQPILEQFILPEGGNVIDDEGTWLTELPMNLDYVVTNEFGEQVLSIDPNVGIPTKGKYRFRIQYQNEDGLRNDILRADYLIPNIREYGWTSTGTFANVNQTQQLKSYAFSLDWNDYADPQAAINCEDYFYEFNFNKVYTVSNFIDRWKWGKNRSRHLGIKEITDRACTTTNNRFPVNDGVRNFDFLFFLFNLMITIFTPVFIVLIPVIHILAFLWPILKWLLIFFVPGLLGFLTYGYVQDAITALGTVAPAPAFIAWSITKAALMGLVTLGYTAIVILKFKEIIGFKFKGINLPMMSFPDCEACPCDSPDLDTSDVTTNVFGGNGGNSSSEIGKYTVNNRTNGAFLADTNSGPTWGELAGRLDDDETTGEPAELILEDYGGSEQKKQSKFQADLNGFRYSIAGYPTPPEIGMPLTYIFSNDNVQNKLIIPGTGITYSQSLNLANIRQRYFDQENLIETTINNQPFSSDPFYDNVLVLLCDSGTINSYSDGSLVTFYNPNDIVDNNISGATLNQFGTNSLTGISQTATTYYSTTVDWVRPNGTTAVSNLYLTATTSEQEYKFKTGVEYFQVITGLTTDMVNNMISTDPNGLLSKYFLNRNVVTYYQPAVGGNTIINLPINQLKSTGDELWKKLEILIMVRGVDPYTQKQKIKYNLSKLFGYPLTSNTYIVEGDYFLNIPIQPNSPSGSWRKDYITPESHTEPITTSKLYHTPYNFSVDVTNFTSVTSNSIQYYSSLDKSIPNGWNPGSGYGIGYYFNSGNISIVENNNSYLFFNTGVKQSRVEGGAFLGSPHQGGMFMGPMSTYLGRTYSPTYKITNPTLSVTINSTNPKLILRSDRLPTSDKEQIYGNNSFLLHQNDNFTGYLLDGSVSFSNPSENNTATDNPNNSADITGDTQSFTDSVLGSFSCEGMVPLRCYSNTTDNNGDPIIQVLDPCDKNEDPVRVKNGCYQLIQKKYVINIGKDIQNFLEWKTRFRFMFGACRGIFSHVFQNNWVNGTLYMFTFKKQTIFDIVGQPKKYKFCGTFDNIYRKGQGPIFYTENTTNSFFYRSAPYDGNNFVGQKPQKSTYSDPNSYTDADFGGMNERNLFFPTTVMDMGPRDEFIKEICTNPNFEGYFVDTLKSTSFNDTADIIQLGIISRLMNSNWLGGLFNAGDSSINKLFSRTEDRLDGDFVQLFSINSEYGVQPFSDDNYNDSDLYVQGSGNATVGIFFSSETINRRLVSPGILTFSSNPLLTNYYGYPKSQVVPVYKWKAATQTSIFGSELNDWQTSAPYYSQKYQELNFTSPGPPAISPYFNDLITGQKGYIYNSDSNGDTLSTWPSSQPADFIVGAPYHFYFGLRKGKSAINRYIVKYILNQDE
jgi:hypothetical protein